MTNFFTTEAHRFLAVRQAEQLLNAYKEGAFNSKPGVYNAEQVLSLSSLRSNTILQLHIDGPKDQGPCLWFALVQPEGSGTLYAMQLMYEYGDAFYPLREPVTAAPIDFDQHIVFDVLPVKRENRCAVKNLCRTLFDRNDAPLVRQLEVIRPLTTNGHPNRRLWRMFGGSMQPEPVPVVVT